MTLALLVPSDYRHDPVLVRLGPADADGRIRYTTVAGIFRSTDADNAALRSFGEAGGEILRLHRDDDTNPSRRPRP